MKQIFTSLISILLIFNLMFITSCIDEEDFGYTKDEFVSTMISYIASGNLELYANWLQNYNTRFFLDENRRQIAFDLKNKFIQFGYLNAHIDSFYLSTEWDGETYNTWQYNVIADLEGSDNPDDIYLMGAHYDCIVDEGDPRNYAPGADDNASGVAAVIEIARVLKSQSFIPKNTIEFICFAAEEYNLDGSADFAKKAANKNVNIISMLNNDMIAAASDDKSSWTVNVADYTNSSSLRSAFVTCGELYTSLNFSHDNSYNNESDSYSFSNEGFEAIFIISDIDDDNYHTANDITGNCNFSFCKEVAELSCAFLVQENM